MSIPTYQFASLGAENIAKKRVMSKAQKGVETEEQRAIKSGQVDESIKNVYRSIIANLEMQKTTITVAQAFINSVVYSVSIIEPPRIADDDDSTLSTDKSTVQKERAIFSHILGTLGRLVNLSAQLVALSTTLADEVVATGKPIMPSIGISKIISLMGEIDKLYGNWGVSGLSKTISQMATALYESGQYPPQLDGLIELWEESNSNALSILERVQNNRYNADLQSINIPTKSKDAERLRGIKEGWERRDFTRAEYEEMIKARKRGDKFTRLKRIGEERDLTGKERALMEELRRQGLLSGDDFTSVYEGRGDDSTIATDYSNAGFGYDSDSGGESDSGMYVDYGDSDDESDYSGAGLYTIYPPVRRPAYDFPPFGRPLSYY